MSEAAPQAPKRFAAARYLLFTTLWMFLLPGVVVHGLLAFFLTVNAPHIGVDWFILGVFANCTLLLGGGIWFLVRLTANLQAGQVPKSCTVLILPFWVPLLLADWDARLASTKKPVTISARNNVRLAGQIELEFVSIQ